MILIISRLFLELFNLFYPEFPKCSVCSKEFEADKVDLCSNCIAKINFVYENYCIKCGKVVAENEEFCVDCQQYDRFFDQARAVGIYDEGLKEYIKLFKYQNQRHLAESLAQLMVIYINRFYQVKEFDLITYIPVHSNRLEERGFNQAYLLAKEISLYFKIELKTLLSRLESTIKQSKLSKRDRINNLKDKFKVVSPKEVSNKNILIVDDIYTTGATVNQASKILLNNEANNIKIITIATGKDLNLDKEVLGL